MSKQTTIQTTHNSYTIQGEGCAWASLVAIVFAIALIASLCFVASSIREVAAAIRSTPKEARHEP